MISHLKRFGVLIVSCLVALHIAAQPAICPSDAKMTSFCRDACIICDIDGFTGRHESPVSGSLPQGFCTTTVHSAQWIGFIAGSQDIEIQLTVSNCRTGSGLEMGMYLTRDCNTFTQVANCNGDVRVNTSAVLKNTVPLIIGQYYYLAMDGNGGDACNWTLKVLKGSTKAIPIVGQATIAMPTTYCVNSPLEINANAPLGTTEYVWEINGSKLNINSSKLTYSFPQVGTYEVCVTPANVCNKGDKVCKTITINQLVQKLDTLVCENKCIKLGGKEYCGSEVVDVTFKAQNGCDSLVTYTIKKIPLPIRKLDLLLCIDDSLVFNNKVLKDPGTYDFTFPTAKCDSLVQITIRKQFCRVSATLTAINPKCHDSFDGIIRLALGQNNFPLRIKIIGLDNPFQINAVAGSTTTALSYFPTINGRYFISIEDNAGFAFAKEVILVAPPALKSEAVLSNYNGFAVSCSNKADGSITVTSSGGTPPYITTLSSNGSSLPISAMLSPGKYTFTTTDKNGCLLIKDTTLTSPSPVKITINPPKATCAKPNLFTIVPTLANKGADKVTFSIEGKAVSSSFELVSGTYKLAAVDQNGCSTDTTFTLTKLIVPSISIEQILNEVPFGDSLVLKAINRDGNKNTYIWKAQGKLSCTTCVETQLLPSKTQFAFLQATSIDGCLALDSVSIRIGKNPGIIAPNIIRKSGNTNTVFQFDNTRGVNSIANLEVYDRWGNLLYKSAPNDLNPKWRPDANLSSGIYVWKADVIYSDDTFKVVSGDVMLVD